MIEFIINNINYFFIDEEQKEIGRAIAHFIVSSESAIATVENNEFKELITLLNAKAAIPCRATLTNGIITYAILVEAKVCLYSFFVYINLYNSKKK